MAADAQSRTEEPTPKRLEEAWAEGRTARSVEVTSAAVLLSGLIIASQRGPQTIGALREMMRRNLVAISIDDFTPEQMAHALRTMAWDTLAIVSPILAVTAMVSLAATVAQVGFRLNPNRLVPDANKLSPANAVKRIFSAQGAVELVKAALKIGLVGWVGWKILITLESQIVMLGLLHPRDILATAGGDFARLLGWVVGTCSIIAALDYAWQRRSFRQSLRMTKGEVKEELRQSEGDPRVRQRVRKTYKQLTRNRMLADVATASVVVTNPVHLAVALRYAPGEMGAPMVIAKGAEELAERIKQIARRHGVPIVERRSLARALFRSVAIGKEIPTTLYRAVAEILAYVYSLQARRAG